MTVAIGAADSGFVAGGHVVVPAAAAGHLLKLIGVDYRRAYVQLALPPGDFLMVEGAVDALRRAVPGGGTGEPAREPGSPISGAWLSTRELAIAVGVSPRRIRTLRSAGQIAGELVDGRLMFAPSTADRVRALRRAS